MVFLRFLWLLVFILILSGTTGCGVGLSKLTAVEKDEMMQAHNACRAKYFSGSQLKWSDSLGNVAQQWADHLASQGYNLVHSSGSYGENLGAGYSTPTDLVNDWCGEETAYSGQAIDNQNYKIFGHFTQVAWKATTEVGCGVARGNSGQIVWVCNYRPAGNIIGQKPF